MTTESFAWSKILHWKVDFNQFMRLRNELVFAAEGFGREENLSPVLIPTMSKDKHGQLKLGQSRWRCGPSLQKDLCDSAPVQCVQARKFICPNPFFVKNKEDEKFQQIVWVNYTIEEFIYLHVIISVLEKFLTKNPMTNPTENNCFYLLLIIFFHLKWG